MIDNNNNHDQFIAKGASLARPPGFTRKDYPYQKDKMEMYIKSTQFKLQMFIKNGDIPIPRPEAKWTHVDLAIMELNTKAH